MTEQERTRLVAVLDVEHEPDTNLVWAATFQAVWAEMGRFFGGPIRVRPASALVDSLNAALLSTPSLAPMDSFRMAGLGMATVRRIEHEMLRRFAEPVDLGQVSESDLVAFAFFRKHLSFDPPFAPLPTSFMGQVVEGFSCNAGHEAADTLRILDYRPRDFVIEIRASNDQGRLIIARTRPAPTLAGTVASVLARISRSIEGDDVRLRGGEMFSMPRLRIRCDETFEELQGLDVLGTIHGAKIERTRERVMFDLDERGMTLKAAALLAISLGIDEDARDLGVSGPFLIMAMDPHARMPYLAAWIENDELMEPTPSERPTPTTNP